MALASNSFMGVARATKTTLRRRRHAKLHVANLLMSVCWGKIRGHAGPPFQDTITTHSRRGVRGSSMVAAREMATTSRQEESAGEPVPGEVSPR
ncbi:unnamed protein product [Ostreobium quekettii]|uniref:Uncharacterized protein n=1 Tax=Ostreobium quekettii TaxID=121088 RepID=A0A8S1J8J1_9CHLO|nr:unnamed protein product [Ostreobium quekettii]